VASPRITFGRGTLGAGADEALADRFRRGAWTAVRRILVPATWKTASNEAVKFDPRSRIRNLTSANRSPKLKARLRELPPARARASRCRIDGPGVQDLPHGGGRDCHAELSELAVDAAVSPKRLLSVRCQASSVAGVTGETSAQRLRGTSHASAASQARSVGS